MESYAAGETEPPLLEGTIGETFEATVARHPHREALVEYATGRRWTWAELDRDVDALAIGLRRAGIGKGDRVGIWAPNCAEWTLVQVATAKIGAILVNINPAYRTHELAYALNQRHHRLPQGRDPEPLQHPRQRLLHHRADPLHRRRPPLHPGALLPLKR